MLLDPHYSLEDKVTHERVISISFLNFSIILDQTYR